MRHILSVRGGGIRGIIPACCLVQLESQLGGLTRDHIDYCAGTSTGALITAAVAAGVPATEILQVYTDRSKEIFTPTGLIADAKRIAEGFMFNPNHLRDVMASELGAAASWTINNSPIPIMISATAVNGHNWFFVRDNPKNARTTGSVGLVDASVASSCAPTYFNHWQINNIQGQTIFFFDGGTGGTANPAYQACIEAFDFDDFTPADTRLIDLGTGFFPGSNTPPSGLLPTIGFAVGTLVDSSEDWVDKAVDRLFGNIRTSINTQLSSNVDEADLSAIPALLKVGQDLAATLDWKKLLGGEAGAAAT